MNLWVLKDKECMDLNIFREKGEIALPSPELNYFLKKENS